ARQAAAHHHYVNRSFLVWHADPAVIDLAGVAAIRQQCITHNVGLITFTRPDDFSTFQVQLPAPREQRDPTVLESFVQERLPEHLFNRLIGEGDPNAG